MPNCNVCFFLEYHSFKLAQNLTMKDHLTVLVRIILPRIIWYGNQTGTQTSGSQTNNGISVSGSTVTLDLKIQHLAL